MRQKFILFVWISCISAVGFSSADSRPVVGFGYTDAVAAARNQQLKLTGFRLALEAHVERKGYVDQLLVSDSEKMGIMSASLGVKRLIGSGVEVIAGFSTALDSALAATEVVRSKKFYITGSTHPALADYGPAVHTVALPHSSLATPMLTAIKKNFPNQRGLLIKDDSSLFSKTHADHIVELLRKPEFKTVQVDIIDTRNRERPLCLKLVSRLKKGEFKYLFITTYIENTVTLVRQLAQNKIDVPFYTNISWTTVDADQMRAAVFNKKSAIFSVAYWLPGSKEAETFERSIAKEYGAQGMVDLAFGYDIGMASAHVLNSIRGPITSEKAIGVVINRPCFTSPISGKICFNQKGGFVRRNLHTVVIDKNKMFTSSL